MIIGYYDVSWRRSRGYRLCWIWSSPNATIAVDMAAMVCWRLIRLINIEKAQLILVHDGGIWLGISRGQEPKLLLVHHNNGPSNSCSAVLCSLQMLGYGINKKNKDIWLYDDMWNYGDQELWYLPPFCWLQSLVDGIPNITQPWKFSLEPSLVISHRSASSTSLSCSRLLSSLILLPSII